MKEIYSTGTAYALWCGAFLGLSGMHRFYMGKKGTGLLWMFTLGLLGFGNLYDLITMPDQIRKLNEIKLNK